MAQAVLNPESVPINLSRTQFERISELVDYLILIMDRASGDENLEGDENGRDTDLEPNITGSHTDLEADTADMEWYLGWPEQLNQIVLSHGHDLGDMEQSSDFCKVGAYAHI